MGVSFHENYLGQDYQDQDNQSKDSKNEELRYEAKCIKYEN